MIQAPDPRTSGFLHSPVLSHVTGFLANLLRGIKVRRVDRTLRLCESLPLGERRFLAVVECGRNRFLIGVTNQAISMLRQLDDANAARPASE